MASQPLSARAEWKQHWLLVVAATAGLTFPATATYSLGLFMEPLSKEFGWGRSTISSGMIVFSVLAMFLATPAGALIDRYGARRIGLPGTVLAMIAVAGFSLASGSTVQWLGLWVVYSFAALMTKPTVWSAAVSRAFTTSRGLALGVVLCGTGISQSLTPIIEQKLIDGYGWRAAYQLLAAGWGGVVLVLLFLFLHDVRGTAAGGSTASKGLSAKDAQASLPGYTFGQAMRTRPVLMICAAVLINSLVTVGVSIHLVPILGGTGLDRAQAAQLAGLGGVAGIAGKLLGGLLLDRYRSSVIPFFSYALPSAAMAILLLDNPGPLLVGLAVLLLGLGGGASMQTSAYLVTRFAGLRSYGAVFGALTSLIGLALGIGPWFAGKVFDLTGGYDLVLKIGVPGNVLAGLLVIGLGAYPVFKTPEVEPAA